MTFTPTRREFVKIGAMAGAGAFLLKRVAFAMTQSPALRKFAQPLRGLLLPPFNSTAKGIPVAQPDAYSLPADPAAEKALKNGVDHYGIEIGSYRDQIHPDLPSTTLYGYGDDENRNEKNETQFEHLGGVIVAQRGKPVQITFRNELPKTHILPVDTTIPGADATNADRAAVHLHGGFVPWFSDGGPHDWFDSVGNHGLSFVNNSMTYPCPSPAPVNGEAEYYWPMDLSARMLWFHDHALGTTRLNAYAAVATALLIRDWSGLEGRLVGQGLPDYVEHGGREVPLVVQDKIFNADGSLYYPSFYDKTLWRYNTNKFTPPSPSCIPEMFGDTMLMNGTVYPTLTVEPRRYRFRLLNACNARFLNLQLFVQDNSADGITLNTKGVPTNPPGPPIIVIGNEGGFLPAPVVVNNPPLPFNPAMMNGNLIAAPAERYDLVIDFAAFPEGTKFILYSDAPAPFPVGSPLNDYFPGAPKNPTITQPGFGPNTRQLMQFVVGPAVSSPDPALNLAGLAMDPAPFFAPGTIPQNVANPRKNPWGANVRVLTLNETFDSYGRLMQLLGTDAPLVAGGTFGRAYTDTPTEIVARNGFEVWQVANLTADTHPMHFHLVNVQVVSRQPFAVNRFNGVPSYTAAARPPEPYEQGWKETVRMNPGEVTTVLARFLLPDLPSTMVVPESPRMKTLGISGAQEYVWHCHILEHEEHDMMRPLIVV